MTGCKWEWGAGKWDLGETNQVYICGEPYNPDAPACGHNIIRLCSRATVDKEVTVVRTTVGVSGEVTFRKTVPAGATLENGKAVFIGYAETTMNFGTACMSNNYSIH